MDSGVESAKVSIESGLRDLADAVRTPTGIMVTASLVVDLTAYAVMIEDKKAAAPIFALLAVTIIMWNAAAWVWRLTSSPWKRGRHLLPLAVSNLFLYVTVIEATVLGSHGWSLPRGRKTFFHHWSWTWTPLFATAVIAFIVYCVMQTVWTSRMKAKIYRDYDLLHTGDDLDDGEPETALVETCLVNAGELAASVDSPSTNAVS